MLRKSELLSMKKPRQQNPTTRSTHLLRPRLFNILALPPYLKPAASQHARRPFPQADGRHIRYRAFPQAKHGF